MMIEIFFECNNNEFFFQVNTMAEAVDRLTYLINNEIVIQWENDQHDLDLFLVENNLNPGSILVKYNKECEVNSKLCSIDDIFAINHVFFEHSNSKWTFAVGIADEIMEQNSK